MAKLSKISPYLQPEIIFNILLRLPTKALIRFMCVCRAWNATIHNKKFIKAHHDLMKTKTPLSLVLIPVGKHNGSKDFSVSISFDGDVLGNNAVRIPQPLEVKQPGNRFNIVSCCNGLVCISITSIYNGESKHPYFAVWNPSIQRLKRIPSAPFNPPKNVVFRLTTYGFGYDSTNDDYKFVRGDIFTNNLGSKDSEVKIYSSKSNSWKQIQHFPYELKPSWYINHRSYVNGSVHWLANPNNIIALDLATEKYNVFPAPIVVNAYPANVFPAPIDAPIDVNAYPARLGPLGGLLYVYLIHSTSLHDIWIMKEYGVAESWTRLYTIDTTELPWRSPMSQYQYAFHYWEPFVLSKSGKQVLLVPNGEDSNMFYWYDMETKRAKQVNIIGIPRRFKTAICAENLNLLDAVPVK